MKTVVIPDIHNKTKLADAIIAKEGDADQCVFLGDIFDDFRDNPDIAYATAEWVRSRIFDDRFVFLWGNHDLGYGTRSRHTKCSGYSMAKDCAIWRVLNHDCWKRWKYFWYAQGWLLSHGGLHPNFLPPVWKEKDLTTTNIKKWLLSEAEKCDIQLAMDDGFHWFVLPGDARFEPKRGVEAGGLIWCDADSEFLPVPKVSQIFGHTPRSFPRIIYGDTGMGRIGGITTTKMPIELKDKWNVCLDCHLQYYGVIEGGTLRIKQTPAV